LGTSNSIGVNLGGQRDKVFNPAVPGSDKSAFYYSAVYSARVEITKDNETPVIQLPANAYITSISIVVGTLFTTGSKVEIGTTAAGTDVLAATAVDAAVSAPVAPKKALIADGVLHVTVTGSPTVGDAFVQVQYSH
jgi:hypothetical protein